MGDEFGMAEDTAGGPFGEFNFAFDLRAQPLKELVKLWRARDNRGVFAVFQSNFGVF